MQLSYHAFWYRFDIFLLLITTTDKVLMYGGFEQQANTFLRVLKQTHTYQHHMKACIFTP